MKYRKLGNNTFVLVSDEEKFGEFCQKLKESHSNAVLQEGNSGSKTPGSGRKNVTQQLSEIVKRIFKDRVFMSTTELNAIICRDVGTKNATYYRKRMIALGLITEKNKTVKPVKITDSPT